MSDMSDPSDDEFEDCVGQEQQTKVDNSFEINGSTLREKQDPNSIGISQGQNGANLSPIVLIQVPDRQPVYGESRKKLPAVMTQRDQISLWSILKQSIGKELSRITMPCIFNEPLSMLQRLTENMEYSHILKAASDADNPVKRMELVAAFAVAGLSSNWERLGKPFNPLLGETFQLDRLEDLGFRIISEQVSHHPPVSAFHADSDYFKFYGSIYPKLKFWGRSVEITPKGVMTLELLAHEETYTWNVVSCSVHNIMIGKLWIEQHGKMEITNHKSGLKCVLDFKPTTSWFGKESNHIEGYIVDKSSSKNRLRCLYGIWTDFLASVDVETFDKLFPVWGQDRQTTNVGQHGGICRGGGKKFDMANLRAGSMPQAEYYNPAASAECISLSATAGSAAYRAGPCLISSIPVLPHSSLLWRVNPRPSDYDQYFHFTLFAIMLNELDSVADANLPPTDSRLRPDVRAMENGDIDTAVKEKHRLEEKQRDKRKWKDQSMTGPIWFKQGKHPLVKEETWHFCDIYWAKDWSSCPDIF